MSAAGLLGPNLVACKLEFHLSWLPRLGGERAIKELLSLNKAKVEVPLIFLEIDLNLVSIVPIFVEGTEL